MKTFLESVLYIMAGLIVSYLVVLMLFGCGTTQHRKEQLELEYPFCTVTDDLEVLCEPPDVD